MAVEDTDTKLLVTTISWNRSNGFLSSARQKLPIINFLDINLYRAIKKMNLWHGSSCRVIWLGPKTTKQEGGILLTSHGEQ